ncbi:MAG: metal-dependent hydrolase [Thermoanaerobaculia bacterium]|nr:metal-dependent hydrolase [Thermoanaerobaculia bacterium]
MNHPRPTFTYLGHSTVRCDLPTGEVILIDPWTRTNPACPPHLQHLERLDVVLITHGHDDHLGDIVEILAHHPDVQIVANFEIVQWLRARGARHAIAMNLGGTVEVAGCQVTMVRADHSSSLEDGGQHIYAGHPAGFVIHLAEGFTFYHAGDTALFLDLQLIGEIHRPELAFLPIGGRFTMDPAQAARACRFLGVREVVGIHWGTLPALTGTPEALERQILTLGVNCRVLPLRPGDRC